MCDEKPIVVGRNGDGLPVLVVWEELNAALRGMHGMVNPFAGQGKSALRALIEAQRAALRAREEGA